MRFNESLVACGAALVLAGGSTTACSQLETGGYVAPVSVEEIDAAVLTAFDEVRLFWNEQGVEGINVQLERPSEDQTISCGPERVTPELGKQVVAAACPATETLFIWGRPMIEQVDEAVENGADMKAVVSLIVKHEYGHFVQKAHNVLGPKENEPIIEPQADCLAGAAMRDADPNAERSVEIYFDGIEAAIGRKDSRHGTSEQRLASFLLGYRPPSNRNCDDVVPVNM